MKKLALLLIFVSSFQISATSQPCLPGGIIFTTQAQIDSFQINYPGCTEIEGDVDINGDDITNLIGLDILISIGGDLTIGFYDWDSINPFLINLEGLNNINSVGGSIIIAGNTSLVSLSGLNGLTSIGEDLKIGTYFYSYGGWFPIGNPELIDITALGNVSSVGGDILIVGNDNLLNLAGIESLTTVNNDIHIGFNLSLSSLSNLENLTYIDGNLELTHNAFSDFTGLNNIDSIGNNLSISGNVSLTNINALENLTFVGGNINISANGQLSSLSGIDNIEPESIIDLTIVNNDSLNHCEVQSICDYLISPNGSITIYDNAVGCNSPVEIASACNNSLPCLPYGNYYFFSQSDIDSFPSYYPNCDQLGGFVRIQGDDINNLDGLSSVTMINGDISIWNNPNLTNVSGLSSVTAINGDLTIWGNPNLTNISGLSNLNIVAGTLYIHGSAYLGSLSGLNSLTYIGGTLDIMSNNILYSLFGLEGLAYVGGDFTLKHNNYLTSLNGINNLTYIGGNVSIEYHPNLQNFTGLDALTSIGGSIEINYSDGLTSMDGLQSLSSIGGSVYLYGNESLSSLEGFDNLNYIGGTLSIHYNDNLTSLTGLENLSSIDGDLKILQNNELNNINALLNISPYSIRNLRITSNPLLSECNIQSICDYLASPNGEILISGNAPGCNSPEEVEEACETVSINETNFTDNLLIHPNPFTTSTTIEYELTKPSTIQLTIYDYLGKQVEVIEKKKAQGKQQIIWNAEGLPAGVYFCVLKTHTGRQESGTQTMKMIKMK